MSSKMINNELMNQVHTYITHRDAVEVGLREDLCYTTSVGIGHGYSYYLPVSYLYQKLVYLSISMYSTDLDAESDSWCRMLEKVKVLGSGAL